MYTYIYIHICHAWTTSHRLHLPSREFCIFGCVQDDSFCHYASCPHIASAVAAALKEPLPIYFPSICTMLPPLRTTNWT